MAELTEQQFNESLNADQKAFFTKALTGAGEAAVTTFKTTSEEERKKAIPEKYELKFPDGTPLDAKTDTEALVAYARERGMTQADAQKFADLVHARAQGVVDRQTAFVQQQRENWKKETEADKDLGGANLATTLVNAKRATDFLYAKVPGLQKMIEDTGYGDNKFWVGMMNVIGKAMAEDKPVINPGKGGKASNEERLNRMYPTMKK